jgi:peptide/nickel transport system permease protein
VARFIIRRVFQGIIVLWLITVAVFAIFFIGPGAKQVPRFLAGKNATPQVIEEVTKRLQLDRPVYVQYWHFVWALLHGNLGYSFYHGQSVNSVLKAAFPITLSLVIGAAIIWVVLGVLSGILSAVKSRTFADRLFTGLALFFYSMPTFVLGLLLLLVFYYELTIHGIHAFPPTYIPFGQSPWGWLGCTHFPPVAARGNPSRPRRTRRSSRPPESAWKWAGLSSAEPAAGTRHRSPRHPSVRRESNRRTA